MASSERIQGANAVEAGRLSPYWGEHVARYRFALPVVSGKKVLDIACGTGYGVAYLCKSAEYVVGIDVDPEAALEASKQLQINSSVLLGDGLAIPFPDQTFDVITSFETIEHLTRRKEFLEELFRVLKVEGRLVLSTPNANYTNPVDGIPTNPFHVFEYSPEELVEELEEVFVLEEFKGQSIDPSIGIPPFFDAQRRLPKDPVTQFRLLCWKAFNKLPFSFREMVSEMIWNKPFYPTEMDYEFSSDETSDAPVLVAICKKR